MEIGLEAGMDQIEDEDVERLWAIHFPKYEEDVRSKTLCLTRRSAGDNRRVKRRVGPRQLLDLTI